MSLTHKEMTAHVRNRIKVAGIKARVKMAEPNIGWRIIMVSPPAYDVRFTEEEQRQIRLIADANHLTGPRGSPIDLDRMTDQCGMTFEFHREGA